MGLTSLIAPRLADEIYGGTKVATDEYPFIARLRISGSGCTGSLVDDDLILTAKHCFVDTTSGEVFPDGGATFNDADKAIQEPGEVTYNMKYIANDYDNDIALAKLEKRATGIKPVQVSKKQVNVGDSVKAVGFGWHDWIGSHNTDVISVMTNDGHLRHIDLNVSSVEENWIYTAVGENNEGPCAGDSGGPMLVWDGEDWSVVATLKGGGFDCRTGNLISRDDKWSSVRVKGFPVFDSDGSETTLSVSDGGETTLSVGDGRETTLSVSDGGESTLPASNGGVYLE